MSSTPPRPPRFPLGETPGGSEAKQVIQDALAKMYPGSGPPFPWIEEDGSALLGCYAALSYTPDVARQFFEVAKTIYITDAVKPRNRELAVLGLASTLNAPYVVFSHRGIASKVGLTTEQVDDAVAGRTPQGLSEEEDMVYRLSKILTTLNGPLDDETWREVTLKMTKTEFVGIVHTIAGYRWITLLDQVNGDPRWN